MNEEPVREEPFIAVPTTLIAPTPYGISPLQRNVPNAVSLSWLKSKEREGSASDVPIKNVVIENQDEPFSPNRD